MARNRIHSASRSVSEQVRTDLIRAISSRELLPGNRLPSTRELGRTYGISHVAVSQAVDQLVAEGYVTKRHGAGTFVAHHPAAAKDTVRLYTRSVVFPQSLDRALTMWRKQNSELRIEIVDRPESADIRTLDTSGLDTVNLPRRFRPLDHWLPTESDLADTFHPFLLTPVTQSGSVYAMPFVFSPEIIAYNRDLVGDRVGRIDYWSLDDLLEAVTALQRRWRTKGIRAFNHYRRFRYQVSPFLPAYAARVVDDELKQCLLAEPETVAALQYCRRLIDAMPGMEAGTLSNIDDLLSGRLALKATPSNIFLQIRRARGIDLDLAPVPSGAQPGGRLTATWLGMTPWCRNPDRAWRAIQSLTGADIQMDLASCDYLFPARREACHEVLNRHGGRFDAIYRTSYFPHAQPTGLGATELSFIDRCMFGWWQDPDIQGRLERTAELVNARLYRVEGYDGLD